MRRLKNYSAGSGYVYQYYYLGYRDSKREGATGTEYIFDVTADRKTFFPVTVFLDDDSVRGWEGPRGRELNSTERYAVAKMALFSAFDERESPREMRDGVWAYPADVEEWLEQLGIE